MIDVSEYQGEINWGIVHESGVLRAYVKLTQGHDHGDIATDPYAASNIAHARAVGIHVGVYHFADPLNDPAREAERFLHVASGHMLPGDLPPALDLEVMPPGYTLAHLDEWKGRFFEVVDREIRTLAVFYSFLYFLNAFHFKPNRPIWGAHPSTITDKERAEWTFWQYGATRVPGVTGNRGVTDVDRVLKAHVPAIPHRS